METFTVKIACHEYVFHIKMTEVEKTLNEAYFWYENALYS